jgi:hypothetical protein
MAAALLGRDVEIFSVTLNAQKELHFVTIPVRLHLGKMLPDTKKQTDDHGKHTLPAIITIYI